MAATANLKRYMDVNIPWSERYELFTVPNGYYFIVSWVFTTSVNTFDVRINGEYIISESNEESDRILRGFIFYGGDVVEVKHRSSSTKETIAICGELFPSA